MSRTSTPTLRAIAEEAGVSVVTVSRILSGKYAGTTTKGRRRATQVRDIAQRLGYRGDMVASAMRTGRTRQIGVAAHRDSIICHPPLTEVLSGLHEVLEAADHSAVLLRMSQHGGADLAHHSSVARGALDALVLIDDVDDDALRDLARSVAVTLHINARPSGEALWITPDDEATSRAAGADLAARGYRRAVLVAPDPPTHPSYTWRERELRAAFEGDGRRVELLDLTMSIRDLGLARLEAVCAPDTVLVAGDATRAMALADAFQHLGRRPGLDVGLAALDSLWGMYLTHPRLSRVIYDRVELGRAAGRMLLQALGGPIDGPRQVRFPGRWWAGDTVRPPPA